MQLSWKTYSLLGFVFIASVILAISIPPSEMGRQLAAIPGGLALIGALYQLVRDEAAHQKKLLIHREKMEFDLGITSHMADIAFDKHVLFCEEYIQEMQSAMMTLLREGITEKMLEQSSRLSMIQERHRAWLTVEIETGLEVYESALRRIGAAAHFYKLDPTGANAAGAMEEARNLEADIFGYKKEPSEPVNEQVRVATVIGRIRKILGIEELTSLRYKLLRMQPGKPHESFNQGPTASDRATL